MADLSTYQKLLVKIYESLSKDVGTTLVNLGAVGWFFSAVAQITMISRNKNIDKKEKKFLIPQEIADGVINVGLYYTICAGIKKWGDSLVERAHIITPATRDFFRGFKNTPVSIEEYIRGVSSDYVHQGIIDPKKTKGRLTRFYKGTLSYFESLGDRQVTIQECNRSLRNSFEFVENNESRNTAIRMLHQTFRDFKKFKNTVGVISAVVASVLACNVITPIARNHAANHYQKKSIDKINTRVKAAELLKNPPVYKHTPSNIFNNFKI